MFDQRDVAARSVKLACALLLAGATFVICPAAEAATSRAGAEEQGALTGAQKWFLDFTETYVKPCELKMQPKCVPAMRTALAEAARRGVDLTKLVLATIRIGQFKHEPALSLRLLDSITSQPDKGASQKEQCDRWAREAEVPLPNGEVRTLQRLLADAQLESPPNSREAPTLTVVKTRLAPCLAIANADTSQ